MNVVWRARDEESISDEGIQRVIFSNIIMSQCHRVTPDKVIMGLACV